MSIIKTKELDQLGFKQHQIKSLLVNILKKEGKHRSKEVLLQDLKQLLEQPESFLQDAIYHKVANAMIEHVEEPLFTAYDLVPTKPYAVFGKAQIEEAAILQMDRIMSLPISLQGALMPDAHSGYGLPIGGVLATKDVVLPNAVGVDIGCRMALSIVGETASFFKRYHHKMAETLRSYTHFGMEGSLQHKVQHSILDDYRFAEIAVLKQWKGKAAKQLGSSGSGNHFVEFGIVALEENNAFALPPGSYVGLLSHSGSRGLGANIAQYYAQLAMDQCRLPQVLKHMAWLDRSSELGQEYWLAMNLAGDYATACHEVIHQQVLHELGLEPIAHIANHHNFAWEEKLADGTSAVLHRKGATPASKGTWGIIPGNMVDPAYLVKGKGNATALCSAAHGAGRKMSRAKAKNSTTVSELIKVLKQHEVQLIGGSVEESPLAYKNIDQVMQAQSSLVSIEGKFYPKIVRMHKD